ncbi:MAG: mechanosensitive ion channel family protein, partial [Pseudomonadota bacterium]
MLEQLHQRLNPYLELASSNVWIQSLVIVALSLLVAWIFDRFISTTLRKFAANTRMGFDDRLIDYLHNPIYFSVILLGLALAITLLKVPEPFNLFLFASLETFAYLVWTVFLVRAIRSLLAYIASNEKHIAILHPQTLPLFQNLAMIIIVVLAVYIIFTAWNVDMTAWLASAGIVGIAVGFAAKDTLANLFSGVFILADAP